MGVGLRRDRVTGGLKRRRDTLDASAAAVRRWGMVVTVVVGTVASRMWKLLLKIMLNIQRVKVLMVMMWRCHGSHAGGRT